MTFKVCLTKVKFGKFAHDRGVKSEDLSIKQREQVDGHQEQFKTRHERIGKDNVRRKVKENKIASTNKLKKAILLTICNAGHTFWGSSEINECGPPLFRFYY